MIGAEKSLKIIHAGALQRVMENCLELLREQNSGLKVEIEGVGSREVNNGNENDK